MTPGESWIVQTLLLCGVDSSLVKHSAWTGITVSADAPDEGRWHYTLQESLFSSSKLVFRFWSSTGSPREVNSKIDKDEAIALVVKGVYAGDGRLVRIVDAVERAALAQQYGIPFGEPISENSRQVPGSSVEGVRRILAYWISEMFE